MLGRGEEEKGKEEKTDRKELKGGEKTNRREEKPEIKEQRKVKGERGGE